MAPSSGGLATLTAPFETFGEIDLVKRAYHHAAHAYHGRQVAGGGPLLDHAVRTARIVLEEVELLDADLVCAALLHATLELPEESYDGLIQHFGMSVATTVRTLSRDRTGSAGDSDLGRRLYLRRIGEATPNVIRVKLAQRLDEVRHVYPHLPSAERNEQVRETERYFLQWASSYSAPLFDALKEALASLRLAS
ncbi:MAG: HD domain-containing protein [Planctomycetes bacterium]|nr:HD domain-containing protein [Planctomycetota bacterium]